MHSFAWWPTVIVVLVATATDLRWRRIPNWLVLPFLAAGIAISALMQGWHGVGQSLEGMALGLVLYGILFWLGGMGAGDVKLCAAIGAWIGPQQLFLALIFTALAGGLMAVGWAVCGGFMGELLGSTGDLLLGRRKRETAAAAVPAGLAAPGAEAVPAAETAPTPVAGASSCLRRAMPYAPAIAIGTLLSFFAR